LNTDFVPTKNLPFSGLGPQTIAGAPSHLTVTFTLLVELPDNKSAVALRKFTAFSPPA
tara:strand:+ start:149 stop:322 length:174 start_codon:yes stop_codon:yes gene_type:complete